MRLFGVLSLPGLLVCVVFCAAWFAPAHGQLVKPGPGEAAEGPPELPAELTPEAVDELLARLTDAEIRAVLRDELRRRADEQAAEDSDRVDSLAAVQTRLEAMAMTIERRVSRWIGALGSLGDRRDRIAERLARAENGVGGMLLSALLVVLSGIAAAWGVGRITAQWRQWLGAPEQASYWDRVLRTLALGLLEFAPVVAFVAATLAVAPLVSGLLGPLQDYLWIYHAGVSNAWAVIIIARRAFAPYVAKIRIAPLSDQAVDEVYRLLRRAALIGLAGWLLAGLSPTLGLGFPPALVLMAFTGTAVALLMLAAVLRNRRRISATAAGLLSGDAEEEAGTWRRVATAAAPMVLAGYLAVAYLYWLAHWLETGQQRLEGPLGTIVVALSLSVLDHLGREVVDSLLGRSDRAERYRGVLGGAWRTILGIVAVFVIAGLWGLDLFALAKGENAQRWAGTLFDIGVTLLLAQLAWRLILAALHSEKPEMSDDPEEAVAESSRLDTLVPIFRNLLLTILATIAVMVTLSSIGVDIGPLLASAGIIGIAVGFGAQTLVRDIFSGVFFLIDDAFRIGEYIELDQDLRGEVEAISIRSLRLRHHRGPVVTIPFGELKSVTNHNRDWVIYKMTFRLEPESDPQAVKKIVKQVGAELMEHPEHGPKFLEPLKSQGVAMIDDDSALVIRIKFKARPRTQFVLRREVYHRLREAFAAKNVRFARRKVEVVSAQDEPAPNLPGAAALEAATPAAGGTGGTGPGSGPVPTKRPIP